METISKNPPNARFYIMKDQGVNASTSQSNGQIVKHIFKFAINIAGGDPVKKDGVREGMKNRFQRASDPFGGWLLDISYDTYDTVMKQLDDWAGIDLSQQSQV